MHEPLRVRVGGDLFHPVLPESAAYVGRKGPGLAASPFANPFRLKDALSRRHPLRGYLEDAVLGVTNVSAEMLAGTAGDLLAPATPRVATAAYRLWLADRTHLKGRARASLAGRNLACWCAIPEPGQPDYCHGAVLLEVCNA